MNVTGPWSRRVCTQPASVTVDPTSAARRSPSVFVRSISLVSRVGQERSLAGRARFFAVRIVRRTPERGDRRRRDVTADLRHDRGEARLALYLLCEVAHDDVAAA